MEKLRLLVADDHRLMLQAVRAILADAEEIEIVGEVQRGSQVLPMVHQTHPDMVLLDIRMPQVDGLTCLDRLRERHPAVKVVMLSGVDDQSVIADALARGASGFIVKRADPDDLIDALRRACHGERPTLDVRSVDTADTTQTVGLTDREIEMLRAVARGLSNRQIAKEVWLSEQTVKFHLSSIYRKLDVSNRTEATRYAYNHGLVEGAPALAFIG